MGAFLSPSSVSEQNLNYSPQAVSDQGVAIKSVGSNFGTKNENSGNASYNLGKGATLTFNSGPDATTLAAAISQNVTKALAATVAGRADTSNPTLGEQILDRTGTQITDAPEEAAAEQKKNYLFAGGLLLLGLFVVMLGKKH